MAGYTRYDVTNQIDNGNTVDAIPLDGEFDAIQTAFAAAGGHKHDGSTGEGAPITVIGPTQDVVASANSLSPKTDNTIDLGTSTYEWRNLFIDGVANIDSLVADTADINAGTIDGAVIGGAVPAAITGTTITATGFVGPLTGAVTGNATTATTLQTPRTINGTSFNGSANITTASWGTARTITIGGTGKSVDGSSNVTWSLSEIGVGTLGPQNSDAVTITGGSISGITDLAVADGGTGASTAEQALINLGLTATAAELNVLDGVLTSTAELNFVDGVTSNIQTQLDGKQPLASTLTTLASYNTNGLFTQTAAGTFTGRTLTGTTNQITVTNGNGVSGNPTISAVIASQAEAEAGTDTAKLLTAQRVAQAIAALAPKPIGVGQTRQNVTASRAIGTSYQNSTGRAIVVTIDMDGNDGSWYFQVSPDNSTWTTINSKSGNGRAIGIEHIVLSGEYYRLSSLTSSTIDGWFEIR